MDLLPRSEIDAPVRNGDNHLPPHDGAHQMRVGVIFSGEVVPEALFGVHQFSEPFLKVMNKARFRVVDVDGGGNVVALTRQSPSLTPTFATIFST